MKNKTLILLTLTLLFTACGKRVQELSLDTISKNNPELCQLEDSSSKGIIMTMDTNFPYLIVLNEDEVIKYAEYKYLICEIEHHNNYGLVFGIHFFEEAIKKGDKTASHINARISIIPGLPTPVVLPLSYLDGQKVFMERIGHQGKGTVLGKMTTMKKVKTIAIKLDPYREPDMISQVTIKRIYFSNTLPEPSKQNPIVDEFGQWSTKEWQGKIKSQEELTKQLTTVRDMYTKTAIDTAIYSKYGGYKVVKFTSNGFFRTHHDGQRWWLVDPDGYGFLSIGMDCMRPSNNAAINGQEYLYSFLPDEHDSLYKEAYETRSNGQKLIGFSISNLIRVFGDDWKNAFNQMGDGILKDNAFNTIGNWSDPGYIQQSNLPYVHPLSKFPETKTMLFRDFPDVFSKEYIENSKTFAQQLEPLKNDQRLIGYFLRNEPLWAFGDHNIAYEMIKIERPSASRDTLITWLTTKYTRIQNLNAAWETSFSSFAELNKAIETPLSTNALKDLYAFSERLVDQYVLVPSEAVKKVDNNHLNLGMRYAWISSDLCYRAGMHFDVFSINGYSYPGAPSTSEIERRTKKPVMIGEFHFGATDRGLPFTGIEAAENQEDRGRAYSYYMENAFARPEMIGIHYFQLNDQTITGRFDGENFNIGIWDVCFLPYKEMLQPVKVTNQRLYEIALGKVKPTNYIVKRYPPIFN